MNIMFTRMKVNYEYYRHIFELHRKGIYVPLYNGASIDGTAPEIYNEYGEKMDVYYFRDIHSTNHPYGDKSRYFIMDRYNYGLDTHIYSNKMMLFQQGKPTRKYGMMIESRKIAYEEYDFMEKHMSLLKEFDKIFTYDEKMLNDLSNASFFPAAATVWYKKGNLSLEDENNYERKSKNLSIISSHKKMCEMHTVRSGVAWECKKRNDVDTYGTFDGSAWSPSIDEVFKDYRFSIVIENDITDYYYTEKILNCFAAQTIPVYLGARKIDQYFNGDGIISITLDDLKDLDKMVSKCTIEEYNQRIPAILDNYKRVKRYTRLGDILYNLIEPSKNIFGE